MYTFLLYFLFGKYLLEDQICLKGIFLIFPQKYYILVPRLKTGIYKIKVLHDFDTDYFIVCAKLFFPHTTAVHVRF